MTRVFLLKKLKFTVSPTLNLTQIALKEPKKSFNMNRIQILCEIYVPFPSAQKLIKYAIFNIFEYFKKTSHTTFIWLVPIKAVFRNLKFLHLGT